LLCDPWKMWEVSDWYIKQGWQVMECGCNPAHFPSIDNLMQTLGINHVLTEPEYASRWPQNVIVHLHET